MKKIVLTGGPNGGKTTALSIIKESFNSSVELVKEAATMIYAGGFPRTDNSPEHVYCVQRIIYFLTNELEGLGEKTANKDAKLLICDRGSVDGAVYWPGGMDDFFKKMNTTREAQLARYDYVIHLSPPLKSSFYKQQDVLRTESYEESFKVDERILQVWDGHPNRLIIAKEADYLEKAKIIKDFIGNLLK